MDFTPIIAQVWGTLGWFIPLMLLIGLLKSPWAKGHIVGARRIRKKSYAKPRHVLARERSQEDGPSYFRKARQSTTS